MGLLGRYELQEPPGLVTDGKDAPLATDTEGSIRLLMMVASLAMAHPLVYWP